MMVKDLIVELQKCPQDADVMFEEVWPCGKVSGVQIIDGTVWLKSEDPEQDDEAVFTPTKYSEWEEIDVLDEPRLVDAMTCGQSHPATWGEEFTATFPNLDQVKKEGSKWYRRTALAKP
jgi:hypothetical protein